MTSAVGFAALPSAECKSELAALLAAACCRLTLARANELAMSPQHEPSCGNAVNGRERHGAEAPPPPEEIA